MDGKLVFPGLGGWVDGDECPEKPEKLGDLDELLFAHKLFESNKGLVGEESDDVEWSVDVDFGVFEEIIFILVGLHHEADEEFGHID